MKLHWGTGILIAFASFIAFILYFVIEASTDEKANHDLVTENYYEEELGYQNDIDAAANARAMTSKVQVFTNTEGVRIQFPEAWVQNAVQGTVSFYRPSNKNLDFEIPLPTATREMMIPAQRLPEGRWNLTIRWKYQGKAFLVKESIMYTEGKSTPPGIPVKNHN